MRNKTETSDRERECDRRTGRSTARRLLVLANACMKPGTAFEFIDHMPNTCAQIRLHARILRRYVKLLQLPIEVSVRGDGRIFVSVESPPTPGSALDLAMRFHETYERLAPRFGYETRYETREFDPHTPNGRLMIAVCREIIERTAGGCDCRLDGKGSPKEFKLSTAQYELLRELRPTLAYDVPDFEPGLAYRRDYSGDLLRLEFHSLDKAFGDRCGFDQQVDTAVPCIVLGGDEVDLFLHANYMDNVECDASETQTEGD